MEENKMKNKLLIVEDTKRIQERYEKLPVKFKRQLTDCPNHWLGLANLSRGKITPEQIYEDAEGYKLASTWPCNLKQLPESTSELERELSNEHLSDLEGLVEEVNQMVKDKSIDLER